ncbi:CvpA family protein [Enterobacteriaceae endosymbiont of Donacia sparganii]|uniref:CvpA family protein n=1 Tax=Enterobacteriaceae endosymbiont of Donacia sparganii TaxID=2675785 RepID=UPI001448F6FF|nr:CvpA family protein [Enterobacteriaceae endosymbiont of Donacia sparganii]QJC35561.1 hypothetical protein GJT98_00345 [Enterobacteriaceae endosymbiont of Donacia sparganii]
MFIIDYLFILILIFSTILSFLKGFVKEILTIFIWFTSFYLSRKYYNYLFFIKNKTINDFYFKKFFLLFIYFILTLISGYIIKNYLNEKITNSYMKNINQILGLFFGMLKGCVIILFLLYSLNHIDKNLYNYILIKQRSLMLVYFNNILQKYKYFL